jgi:hypothetical protein
MRIFLSVFLVSGEINFNFGRSAFFLSKSEVKISQFVSLKTRDFTVLRATRIEKIRETFFHKIREYTRLQFPETRPSFTAHSALFSIFPSNGFRYIYCISDRTTLVVRVKTDIYISTTGHSQTGSTFGLGPGQMAGSVEFILSFLCADG